MKRSARLARQILKTRAQETRAAAAERRPVQAAKLAKSCRRRARSLSTHVLAAGVDTATADGVASALRSVAKRKSVKPSENARTRRTLEGHGKQIRSVRRYSRSKVVQLLNAYNPRKPEFREARRLMLAA